MSNTWRFRFSIIIYDMILTPFYFSNQLWDAGKVFLSRSRSKCSIKFQHICITNATTFDFISPSLLLLWMTSNYIVQKPLYVVETNTCSNYIKWHYILENYSISIYYCPKNAFPSMAHPIYFQTIVIKPEKKFIRKQ